MLKLTLGAAGGGGLGAWFDAAAGSAGVAVLGTAFAVPLAGMLAVGAVAGVSVVGVVGYLRKSDSPPADASGEEPS